MDNHEQLRRWRLILGGGKADGTGAKLEGDDQRVDRALDALYGGTGMGGYGRGDADSDERSA